MEKLEITPEIAMLLLIILVSGFITLYFLLGNAKDDKGAKWIGLYFLAFTLTMVCGLLTLDGFDYDLRITANKWGDLFGNFEGIFLFLFIKKKTFDDFSWLRKDFWIYLPTVVVVIISLFGFLNLDFTDIDSYKKSIFCIEFATRIFYGVLSIIYIKKYKAKTFQNYSNLEQHNANWMELVIYSYLIYSIFPFIWGALVLFSNIDFINQNAMLGAGMVVLTYVCLILWKILQNAHIMVQITREESEIKSKGYKNTDNNKDESTVSLHEFMTHNKPFLNSQITLKELATQLNYTPRELSKNINEKLGVNFYDFINQYRVEYAKKLLLNPPDRKMTISEIFYQSGFNSKSSFNTAFKKHTGQTPSSFKS